MWHSLDIQDFAFQMYLSATVDQKTLISSYLSQGRTQNPFKYLIEGAFRENSSWLKAVHYQQKILNLICLTRFCMQLCTSFCPLSRIFQTKVILSKFITFWLTL